MRAGAAGGYKYVCRSTTGKLPKFITGSNNCCIDFQITQYVETNAEKNFESLFNRQRVRMKMIVSGSEVIPFILDFHLFFCDFSITFSAKLSEELNFAVSVLSAAGNLAGFGLFIQ